MRNFQVNFSQRHWLPALAFAGALAACGGGGGDSGGSAVPTSLALTGTAATGAAIAGQTVDVKCATGTGSAVTQANGNFSVSISGGALPCVLRVTAADGTLLHSVATGGGASAVANLTPLTELVVAALTAAEPGTLYSGFSAGTAGAVTAANITAAITLVVNKLAPLLDLSTIGNPLTATLVAANGANPGDAYDVVLDSLKAFLTDASTTLSQFTLSVIREKQVIDDPSVATASVAVPPELLLRPAASNCLALRSGRYRVVTMKGSMPSVADQTDTFVLNAATLGFRNDDGSTGALTATGPCQFTEAPDKATDISVSQAGIVMFRSTENGAPRLGIAFPEQTHALAALAGDWNMVGLRNLGASFAPDAGSLTFNASGVSTANSYCADVKTCTAQANVVTLVPNAAGGFNRPFDNGSFDRVFAYRAGGGEMILVAIAGGGTIRIWTRQRTLALPTVGAPGSSWDYEVNSQSAVPAAPFVSSTTILSADAATGVFTREAVVSPGVTRVETLIINTPRPGYRLRNAATVPTSNGGTSNVRESIAMNLRGMGVTATAFPVAVSLLLSVSPPP
jgi:hypothetical protein